MLTQTMPSAPLSASLRNVASNAPGEGAAVSGSRGECSHRCQKPDVVRSCPSTSSSLPNLIVSGTIEIPSEAASSGGRSQELSVTTRMPDMTSPSLTLRGAGVVGCQPPVAEADSLISYQSRV